MITYLKSEEGFLKINGETKELLTIMNKPGSVRISTGVVDEGHYVLITIVKVEEGFFTAMTEEEFLAEKEIAKAELIKFGF